MAQHVPGAIEILRGYLLEDARREFGRKDVFTVQEATPKLALTEDSAERKATPMATGLLDYFPAALAYVSKVSKVGNDKHNPGTDRLTWSRGISSDHADTIIRHLADRGLTDNDGIRHSGYVAWRALALLQEELEAAGAPPGRASVFPAPPKPHASMIMEKPTTVSTHEYCAVCSGTPDWHRKYANVLDHVFVPETPLSYHRQQRERMEARLADHGNDSEGQ